jgi:hypothetical protein
MDGSGRGLTVSSRNADGAPPSGERLLGPEELTGHLGVPLKTIYRWHDRGEGPASYRVRPPRPKQARGCTGLAPSAARAERAHGVVTCDAPRRPEPDSGVMLRSAKCPRESAEQGVRTRITEQCFRSSAGTWPCQPPVETESGDLSGGPGYSRTWCCGMARQPGAKARKQMANDHKRS